MPRPARPGARRGRDGVADRAGRALRLERGVSAAAARRALWLVAVIALPVPILLLGPGHVPPAQLAQLGGAALAFGLAESLRGVVGWTAAIFLGQALLYALALWALSGFAARRLGRARTALVAIAAVLAITACFVPAYRTPYHATTPHATLLEVYR